MCVRALTAALVRPILALMRANRVAAPPKPRVVARPSAPPAPLREARPGADPATAAVLRLQGSVGNRVVSQRLSERQLQRHIGPTLNEEVDPGTGTDTASPDYQGIALSLKMAMEGLGTDEAAIYAALTPLGRDATKIMAVSVTYLALTGRDLMSDLKDELSGSELDTAVHLMSPPDRKELIQKQMMTTASGIWAATVIAAHGIPVDYEYAGTGSFHQAGKIYLNKNVPIIGASIVMMHEAQHALTFKSGKAADINALTKEVYVRTKIADEAEAVVRAIEGAAPTAAAGLDIAGSGLTADLIKQYQDAHAAEVKKLTDADPKTDPGVAAAKARTTVRDGRVTNWFHDGTFVTSTGPLTYSEHYGRQWDAAHATPAEPATVPPTEAPTPVINT